MKVVIRADASIKIGAGHVMRCLTLADALKKHTNVEVIFVCREQPGQLREVISKRGYEVISLPEKKKNYDPEISAPAHAKWLGVSWKQDIEDTLVAIGKEKVDWLIVDHYAIDYRWHQSAKTICNKLMVIDDLADRKYDCDILLDQTYGRNPETYHSLVKEGCQLLVGAKYTLLVDDFFRLRYQALEKRKKINKINRILVSLGSMDPDNLTSIILRGLNQAIWEYYPDVDVVLGSHAPHLQSVINESKQHKLNINVHVDVSNMAELMLYSDLAIGTGGTTSWERCCLGLPTIILQLADNQKEVIRGLIQTGAVRYISGKNIAEEIVTECAELQSNIAELHNLSDQSFKVVNGIGAHMAAIRLLPEKTYYGKDVAIRYVNQSDGDLIYKWQTDPKTRLYSDNPALPEYEEHILWLENKLNDHTCFIFMMEHANEPAGVVRLDYNDESNDSCFYVVSIYIAPEFYRKGIGSIALNYISRIFDSVDLHAKIHDKNIASQQLFLSAGYIQQQKGCFYIRKPLKVNIVDSSL